MATTTQLGTRIDADVHRKFKLLCVIERQQMSDVVRELIEGWIEEREQDQEIKDRLDYLMAREEAIAALKKK